MVRCLLSNDQCVPLEGVVALVQSVRRLCETPVDYTSSLKTKMYNIDIVNR